MWSLLYKLFPRHVVRGPWNCLKMFTSTLYLHEVLLKVLVSVCLEKKPFIKLMQYKHVSPKVNSLAGEVIE